MNQCLRVRACSKQKEISERDIAGLGYVKWHWALKATGRSLDSIPNTIENLNRILRRDKISPD